MIEYIVEAFIDADWVDITNKVVAPFYMTDRLDEVLDTGKIILSQVTNELIKPFTPIRIELRYANSDDVDIEYMIAADTSRDQIKFA